MVGASEFAMTVGASEIEVNDQYGVSLCEMQAAGQWSNFLSRLTFRPPMHSRNLS